MSGWLRRLWPRRSKRSGETFAWERTRSAPVAASPTSDGRRPLSQLPYLLPKDVLETDRLNFQHYLIRGILHGDYAAPLHADITSILDSGSGTGRWVTEMARAFPGAQVVGLDIAQPAQPAYAIPPNARLVQANLLDGLPFADRSFDFVHQRLLVLAIPAAHWPGVLAELVRVTRPGGWIELLEGGDVFLNAGPAMQQFLSWWQQASHARGFDTSLIERLDSLLLRLRLHNIMARTLEVPVGKWGGRTGELLEKNILAGFPGLKPLLCSHCALSPGSLMRLWQNWQPKETAITPSIIITSSMDNASVKRWRTLSTGRLKNLAWHPLRNFSIALSFAPDPCFVPSPCV